MVSVLRKRARPTARVNSTTPPRKVKTEHRPENKGPGAPELNTIGDLIHVRASELESKDHPLVFYPSSGTEYVGHTAAYVDELSNRAATYYQSIIPGRANSDMPPEVVALLGPSNFDYFIGLLGLSKLGHTILFLSTRISEEAHLSLLNSCKAVCLLVDDGFQFMGDRIQKQLPSLVVRQLASRTEYESCEERGRSDSHLDPSRETNNVAWIIHSSGSTSLPKPNYQTHTAALGNFKSRFSLVGFITLPLFHMQGLGCVFRSIMNRKQIYMYNAALPLTSVNITATLKEHPDIQILYGVPYAMKLLADNAEGIELCKELEVLFCGGGACPKAIGDKLVTNGVYLVSHFGSSETGQLMNSYRPHAEIEEWDWLRPSADVQPYLRWDLHDSENSIYELVVLDGWPSKVATNREDGSYATKDLWHRHPDYPIKNAWRYYARKDDTIVLVNGEKANPLLFEDFARESSLVDDAIVFGSQKPHLGMFIVASNSASTRLEILDAVWPAIQKGNERAPSHAQLSKDMIGLLSAEDAAHVRRTDKAALIRSAFYKEFAPLIDAMYAETNGTRSLALDETDLRSFLRTEIEAMIHPERRGIIQYETDLFSFGLDSLQASRIRSAILKNIDTGQEPLEESFVFDYPSITSMASELLRKRDGRTVGQTRPADERMQQLIDKYSLQFTTHDHGIASSPGECIVVTGATGSLGAHLVALLAAKKEVSIIYCLIRARSDGEAKQRLRQSFNTRQIDANLSRVRAYATDLSEPHLGLPHSHYQEIASKLTCCFHCAWSVNFKLGLDSFENCISGTRHLINLCLRSGKPDPAGFVFCSSISTVANTPDSEIQEEIPTSLKFAQDIGYAQSKLVAEHICLNAMEATCMTVQVLRIGQIVGDTKAGVWNRQEAIPIIIQSANTIGLLPALNEWHSWLPVDTVAAVIIEMWFGPSCDKTLSAIPGFFNIVNEKKFRWIEDLLPMLENAGLKFDIGNPPTWLRRLRENPDPVANPPYKLIEFFEAKYGSKTVGRTLNYRTDKARAASSILRTAPLLDQNLVDKFVEYILTGSDIDEPSKVMSVV